MMDQGSHMDPAAAAEDATACDNHVWRWTVCDKPDAVNNPNSVRRISTSAPFNPAHMNPFSAPRVHSLPHPLPRTSLWQASPVYEQGSSNPLREHNSYIDVNREATDEKIKSQANRPIQSARVGHAHDSLLGSTGASCAQGPTAAATVPVAVAPPALRPLPSSNPTPSSLVCGVTATEGGTVTLLMGKHKGKRARVLGPAKKKYRVQVEGLAYQLEYYPSALGLPELKAESDSILVTGPSASAIMRTTPPPGIRISCDSLRMAPAAEDKVQGGDTVRLLNESGRRTFPLDGYQSWVGHRLRVKRGKYQGKHACVLSLASAKLRVSVEGVDYQLEFYPAMFDPPPGWIGSLTDLTSMNGCHSILNGGNQHGKTLSSFARDKQNASTSSRAAAKQMKANVKAVKSQKSGLNAKGCLSPRSKGIAKSPRSTGGRPRSSASPTSASVSGKTLKDSSLVGIHLACTASNRSISMEVDQQSSAIKNEDSNLRRNTSTGSCANHHLVESIVMEVDGLESGNVQGQQVDVDEPLFSAGFSALLQVASSLLGKS